jgi:folate-binding protein YgfZ
MTLSIALLPERAAVEVRGAQAEEFLHGLLTCEVRALKPGEAAYGALLTPQGKILFDLFLARTGDVFLLDGAAAQVADVVKRLTLYRLRSKVDITPKPELGIAAIWGGDPPTVEGGFAYRDPRLAALGWRAMAPSVADHANASADDYRAMRIGLGVADAEELGSGQLYPHEANLDQLNGISFSKGCYVGQEVVSRMEHRGSGGRNRIVPLRCEGTPAPGTEVVAGERKLGSVLSAQGDRALGLLRLDRVEAAVAEGQEITAGGRSVAIEQPAWARFTVPVRRPAA